MSLIERAAEVLHLLEDLDLRTALVGGLAVSIRSEERFTRDIDFAVAVASDADAEAVALGFQRSGYTLHTVLEHSVHGIISTLRFLDPASGMQLPAIDLLVGTCGIEREIVTAASVVAVTPTVDLPVAQVPHLIAMKLLSVADDRPNDRADLQSLFAVASEHEIRHVRELLAQIRQRRFHRGRDLEGLLQEYDPR